MRPLIPILCHALIVIALTLLTQIGGIAYLIALLGMARWPRELSRRRRAAYLTLATVGIYTVASIAIVPPLAGLFGRERAPYPRHRSAARSTASISGRRHSR